MTYARTGAISLDQFIEAAPSKVWRALTDSELLAQWWAPGDIGDHVGHEFHLQMPGFGSIPCKVIESQPYERFVYTFGDWTLTWRLVPEGRGTRLLLDHSGFDLDNNRDRNACERMGPGWRDTVLPELVKLVDRVSLS